MSQPVGVHIGAGDETRERVAEHLPRCGEASPTLIGQPDLPAITGPGIHPDQSVTGETGHHPAHGRFAPAQAHRQFALAGSFRFGDLQQHEKAAVCQVHPVTEQQTVRPAVHQGHQDVQFMGEGSFHT